MTSEQSHAHRQIPADRCYWAILDASVLGRRWRVPDRQLGYLLERFVPVPLEDLHAIYRHIGARRYLACAVARTELTSMVEGPVLTLTPDALPAGLDVDVESSELNLLRGPMCPPRLRQLRRLCVASIAVAALACVVLGVLGLERRAGELEAAVGAIDVELGNAYTRVFGNGRRSALPADLELTSELRRLRSTRAKDLAKSELEDSARTLARLFALWPSSAQIATDAVQVTQKSIHVHGTVQESAKAEELAAALSKLEGWRADQPTVRAAGGSFQMSLELVRAKEGR